MLEWTEILQTKLGPGIQQHSNNSSPMLYSSDVGVIRYIHELRKKSGSREFQEYISAYCLLCSNQLFDFSLSSRRMNIMVNGVPA
jgi:hypothetical protein